LINCYKILEVVNFSDNKTVQGGFRKMAKKYHPDVNLTKEASDIFVVVSKAYQTLIDQEAKHIHDSELKKALLWESEPAFKKQINRQTQRGFTAEKRKKWAYAQAKREIADFDRKNHFFPFKYRIVGGAIFAIFALNIIYQNYFIDLNSNELPLTIFGYGMFVVSCVSVLALVYKKLRVDLLLKRAKFAYDKFSFVLFFSMLLIGPISVLGLNSYRQVYHLEHYPALATARIVEITTDNGVIFSYKPIDRNHIYMKRKSLNERHIYDLDDSWIIVRYSLADPRIVELVER
jgi:curved DNA-binding protein CbpA